MTQGGERTILFIAGLVIIFVTFALIALSSGVFYDAQR